MIALLQNELVLTGIIIALVLGIVIHKWFGLGRLIRVFTGSGKRVEVAKAKTAKAKTAAQKKADEAAAAE